MELTAWLLGWLLGQVSSLFQPLSPAEVGAHGIVSRALAGGRSTGIHPAVTPPVLGNNPRWWQSHGVQGLTQQGCEQGLASAPAAAGSGCLL